MRTLFGTAVIMVGLAACTRTPDVGKNQAESPATATPSALLAAENVPAPANGVSPAEQQQAAPGTPDSGAGGSQGRIGRKCEYVDTPGSATVTAIHDEPVNGDCSKQPKKVTLNFVPDDAAAKSDTRDKAFSLVVGGVSFVAAGCLDAYRIAVGTKLKTVRHTITAGTCSPIVYEVAALSSEADINKCVAFCNK